MGVGGQHHAPATLPPGKPPYPLHRRLDGPQGQSGWVWKISPTPWFNIQADQPIANIYIYPTCYLLTTHDNFLSGLSINSDICLQTHYSFSRRACNTSIDGFTMNTWLLFKCTLTAVNITCTLRDCKTHKLTSVASTVVMSNNLITVQ